MCKIVAIDVGGTAIKAGLWNGTELTLCQEWDTQALLGGQHLMNRVIQIIRTYSDYDAIGISTAGEVNTSDGSIIYANNNIPDYIGMQIKSILEGEFCVPVVVENDVNSAALGELSRGAGKGCKDFLCLTYGTGVGGCIIINGKVYSGSNYAAGSFGGIVIHPELRIGNSSLEGCYERCASTTALVQRVRMIDHTLSDGRKIFKAIHRIEIKEQIDAWIDDICTGLVTLVSIFNPERIILGGGVMAQDYVICEIRKKVRNQLSPALANVEIVQAVLGNKAGMMGVVYLADKLCTSQINK